MQTDETIDRYFYITGWICIAVFAALAAVIGVCGTQILTKVPPCPLHAYTGYYLSLIHISEPTRQAEISYAVFCLKKKKNIKTKK